MYQDQYLRTEIVICALHIWATVGSCPARARQQIHQSLTTASLAQVDKALKGPESNLFCCDTGSIRCRPIFFSVLFLYFLQKPRYLFQNKLRIERDLDTDFSAQVILTCESIERQSKYHSDRRKRDVMH